MTPDNIAKTMDNIIEMSKKMAKIRRKIVDAILKLPDNPDIERLGDGGNCFQINSSVLGTENNWSPHYHDFRAQYRLICGVISDTPIEDIPFKLKTMVDKKIVATGGATYRLHPQVAENLKTLME